MILSVLHKFVFIKGFKVGGTSCEIALSQLCGPDDILTPISPADERQRMGARNFGAEPERLARWLQSVAAGERRWPPPGRYYNHMPLAEVRQQFGPLDGYRVVCVERSPYAKVLSFLNWRLGKHGYREGVVPTTGRAALAEQFGEDVLRVRNIDRYRDRCGRVTATCWRLASLADELAAFSAELGRPSPLLPHVKRGWGSERLDPTEWLTPDQIRFVNEHFAEEFEVFGYDQVHPVTGERCSAPRGLGRTPLRLVGWRLPALASASPGARGAPRPKS